MEDRLPRKLAAILYADVAEYSRLTGDDEDSTHRALSEFLDLVTRTIESNRGEVVHYAGDAVLAMFGAVVDAVSCAIKIQGQLRALNADLPDQRKVQFRIGVNLGDVIEDRGDIYGDGVNVAARLESIADPGGICISASVFEQIKGKFDLRFEDMGERELKNISEKIRSYRLVQEPRELSVENFQTLTGERLDLPDKPSIAVLPFQNMSGDLDQEPFADGISEDIITVLSRIPDLIVIARNSTFVYKGRAVDVREVGRELGVGYVLEGSIQKAGERLRITAQLVDTHSGDHLWAERYDRNLDDIFAIQDEITREIVVALSVKLTYGDEFRVWSEYASNFETWEIFQRGMAELLKLTREGNDQAQRIGRRLLQLEPDLAHSKIYLGWVLQTGARYGFIPDASAASAEAETLVREVLAEDEQNGDAHAMLGYILVNQSQHDEAITHGERAIELGPSVATNHAVLAFSLFYKGEHAASLARMKKAIRLTPYAPDWYLAVLGDAYRSCDELEQARAVFEHLAARMPGSLISLIRLISVYSDLAEWDRARQTVDELMAIIPDFSVRVYMKGMPFKFDTDRESLSKALLTAGLPE